MRQVAKFAPYIALALFGILFRYVQVGFALPCTVDTDMPYKSPSSSSVYYITSECKKQPIRNPDVYFSHFSTWKQVRVVPRSVLGSIVLDETVSFLPYGPRKKFDQGSLVKIPNDPKVYIILNDHRYHIVDETVFQDLGLSWNWIEDVTEIALNQYAFQSSIQDAVDIPNTFLFKYANTSEVYEVRRTEIGTIEEKQVTSAETIRGRYRLDRIAVITKAQLFGKNPTPFLTKTITTTMSFEERLLRAVPEVVFNLPQVPLPPPTRPPTLQTVAANYSSPLGTNLGYINDTDGEWPFVDAFKQSRPWISGERNGCWGCGPTLDLDEHGWVRSLRTDTPNGGQVARTIIFSNDAGNPYPTGRYTVLYDGRGTVEYGGTAVKNDILSSPGRDIVDVSRYDGHFLLIITQTDPAEYVRNIRVIMPGGVCANDLFAYCTTASQCNAGAQCQLFTTNYDTQIFHPTFLNNIKRYKVLRFAHSMRTDSSPVREMSDYVERLDARWPEMPVDVMIDLANRIDAAPWWSIPHLASDAFVRELATLTRDRLRSNRKVYIEFSNEPWNTVNTQSRDLAVAGCARNMDIRGGCDQDQTPGNGVYCEGHPYPRWVPECLVGQRREYSQRAVETQSIFTQVFGGTNRLVRILSAQLGNTDMYTDILSWRNASAVTDAVAVAPYVGSELGEDASVSTWDVTRVFSQIRFSSLPQVLQTLTADAALLRTRYPSTSLFAYEGGQHLAGVGAEGNNVALSNLFIAANRDQRMGQLYTDFLDAWRGVGGQLFVHSYNVRAAGLWGSPGALEYQSQSPLVAPKYTALMNYVTDHPCWWANCTGPANALPVRAPNVPPTVSAISPVEGASITQGQPIVITANASDIDGAVVSVSFYNGTSLLGTDSVYPYSYTWTGATTGTKSITVRAIDIDGALTTSATRTIAVVAGAVSNAPVNNTVTAVTATVGGSRPAPIYIPSGASASNRRPLVIGLHGYSWTGYSYDQQILRMTPLVESRNFFLILPDGTRNNQGTSFWNATPACCDFDNSRVDDVGYIRGLIDEAIQRYPIDPTQVYLVGNSNGGFLSERLAYEIPDRLTAIVDLVGSGFDDDSQYGTTTPVSILEIHGLNDDTVLYNGNPGAYPSTPNLTRRWATRLGCNINQSTVVPDIDLTTYPGVDTMILAYRSGCAPGYEAQMWSIQGGSHLPNFNTEFPNIVLNWLFAHRRGDTNLPPLGVGQNTVAPVITLTSPVNGAGFFTGSDIAMSASASDIDGTIDHVDFYVNDTRLGTDATAPYELVWFNAQVPDGAYTISARAFDNDGAQAVTDIATINISVTGGSTSPPPANNQPPTVSMTYPQNGDVFPPGVNVPLRANATDDSRVSRVEFYIGNVRLGQSFSAPYSSAWYNAQVPDGTYTIYARAYDNYNVGATSTPVSIVFRTGAPDPNAAQNAQGAAPPPPSPVYPPAPPGNRAPAVTLSAPTEGTQFPPGANIPMSANATDPDDTIDRVEFYVNGGLLDTDRTAPYSTYWFNAQAPNGTYTLTARAYDSYNTASTSAAIHFVIQTGVPDPNAPQAAPPPPSPVYPPAPPGNQRPTTTLTGPQEGATYPPGATIPFSATASDLDGTIDRVSFYINGALLDSDYTAPYAVSWVNAQGSGQYTITARAFDNYNVASATSSPVRVTLQTGAVDPSAPQAAPPPPSPVYPPAPPGNVLPTVTMTGPAENTTYYQGGTVPMTATASDADGTIDHVSFYINGTLLDSDYTTPYAVSWVGVQGTNGVYTLTARAFDNYNAASVTSSPVHVNLQSVAPPPPAPAPTPTPSPSPQSGGGGSSGTFDPTTLNDDFSSGSSLANWTDLNAALHSIYDINTSRSGYLTLAPAPNAVWYQNTQGPFVYKTVTGDFIAETHMIARSSGNASSAPVTNYNSAGLYIRSPQSTSGAESWIGYNLGNQGGGVVGTQRVTTINSNSVFANVAATFSGYIRICRIGANFYLLHRLDNESAWTFEPSSPGPGSPFYRTDFGTSVQIGFGANTFESAGDIVAEYDYLRFSSTIPVVEDQCTGDL